MDYHVFSKTLKNKSGKVKKQYYAWYYSPEGKRKQIVCKDCRTKNEALAYCSSLPAVKEKSVLIKDIARLMYLPESDHLKRRVQLGRPIEERTMHDARSYLDQIIEKWGACSLAEIKVPEVGNYLFSLDRSASWKNRYISIFKEIYDEAAWQGFNIQVPVFPHFTRPQNKKDIFSTEELKLFFELENFQGQSADAQTLYLFFMCIFLAGLRISEARALRPVQFIFDRSALVIDGFCKENGERTNFNKKGSVTDPKTRLVCLPPDFSLIIQTYIQTNNIASEDFLFTYHNLPLRREYAESVFRRVLKYAGIDTSQKKLTPHSLRYTYVTRMRRELSVETVQKLVGHTSQDMTDYYTRFSIDTTLAGIKGAELAVQHLFD